MGDDTYHDYDGNPISLYKLVRTEPDWAASRIRDLMARLDSELTAHAMTTSGNQVVIDGLIEERDRWRERYQSMSVQNESLAAQIDRCKEALLAIIEAGRMSDQSRAEYSANIASAALNHPAPCQCGFYDRERPHSRVGGGRCSFFGDWSEGIDRYRPNKF